MRADKRGDDPAPVDVADENDGNAGLGRKAHVGDVAGPQVDFGRRPRTLDNDEVGAIADMGKAFSTDASNLGFSA